MAKDSRKKKNIGPTSVLSEIDRIFEQENFYQSRQSGKRFYDSGRLPKLLAKYIVSSGEKVGVHATKFGMSASTLESILQGGRLSDNMLSRKELMHQLSSHTNATDLGDIWS